MAAVFMAFPATFITTLAGLALLGTIGGSLAGAMAEVPASLKKIKPYLERGAEIKARDPIVAYHCRLYALQEAMKMRKDLPKADMGFILGLMDELEKEKAALGGDADDAQMLVENFGQDLFQNRFIFFILAQKK